MVKVVNDLLDYHGMKIVQNSDWFSFSLDSVLLSQFVTLNKKAKNILDLGTGNAPIPLFLSKRTSAHIWAIEIQKDCYDLALESIKINNLEDQIRLINDDMKRLKKYFSNESFDVIVSNPPYFEYSEEKKLNKNDHKTIARHEINIKLEEVISISSYFLKTKGVFAMVHRTDRLIEIINLFEKYKFSVKKLKFIYSKEQSESNIFLIEGIKNGGKGTKVLTPTVIHDYNGNYKEDLLKVFKGNLYESEKF